MGTPDRAAIEVEIAALLQLGIDELRTRWTVLFGKTPPKGLTKDLLKRMIAYRIQERAYGGLDRETIKLLDRLARGASGAEPVRRLKPGTVLIREYQGERHTVTVVPAGYLWREETYQSLSSIAKAITGTSWNGPRFFGLRQPDAAKSTAKEKNGPAPARGRRRLKMSTVHAGK